MPALLPEKPIGRELTLFTKEQVFELVVGPKGSGLSSKAGYSEIAFGR
jgi:hypothetical protein